MLHRLPFPIVSIEESRDWRAFHVAYRVECLHYRSGDGSMEKRRAEIEAKRARLAELRQQRESRQAQAESRTSSSASQARSVSLAEQKTDIDQLVTSLLGDAPEAAAIPSEEANNDQKQEKVNDTRAHLVDASTQSYPDESTSAIASDVVNKPLNVPEVILYSKIVQTDSLSDDEDQTRRAAIDKKELSERIKLEMEEAYQQKQLAAVSLEDKVPTLKGEDIQNLLVSDRFKDFIDKSSKVIERTLDESYDVLVDYGIIEKENEDSTSLVRQVMQFYSPKWSHKRAITSLDWNPKFSELCLTAYTKNSSARDQPDGVVQVWNMHLHDRPEYVFTGHSDILSAQFSPFHPNLIIGGAYSGQIAIWDTRAKSQAVLKSPLTGVGHTHPVYSLAVVGTQTANNIVTCSTDGLMCGWTVDMLAQPQEYIELTTPPPSKLDNMAPTTMTFPAADPTFCVVGTEEGTIYPINRYDRAGAKAGVDQRSSYKGHAAMITGVEFHPSRGLVDLGSLLLSSSLDWGVKLWQAKQPGTVPPGPISPIMQFPREDAVYDVKWSPARPGVWASVDETGHLDVWDLTEDAEVPIARVQPTTKAPLMCSLNKLSWEKQESRHIAVGGLDGVVSVFDVGRELGGPLNMKAEEWMSTKKLTDNAQGAA